MHSRGRLSRIVRRPFEVSTEGSWVVDKKPNLTIINLCDPYMKLHYNSYPLDIAKYHYGFPSNEFMNVLRRKFMKGFHNSYQATEHFTLPEEMTYKRRKR